MKDIFGEEVFEGLQNGVDEKVKKDWERGAPLVESAERHRGKESEVIDGRVISGPRVQ